MNQADKTASEKKLFTEFPPITIQEWEQLIHADLKGADYEKKLIWKTIEGFDVKPYYRNEDIAELPHIHSLPGEFPFVRGYKKSFNTWEIRQDISESVPAEANIMALKAISRGANSIGFNVQDIAKTSDLKKMLHGIDLAQTQLHFKSSSSYSIFASILIDYLRENKIDKSKLKGSFNFDHFAYYLLHSEYYNSLSDNLNELKCLLELMKSELPQMQIINVNGKLFHNAGGNVVQELGFTLSTALEYMSALTAIGISAIDILPRMRFSIALGGNYFFDIAKIRALRMLWAQIAREYTSNEELCKVFIHAETSLWNKTIYDPYVNMLRTTTEAMSGAIAGADSINVLPFDVAYTDGNEFSNRIARNTQIILKEESYLDKIADPAAGSYYIESITDSIAGHAWELLLKVEDAGGYAKAMESGFVSEQISLTASKRDMEIAMRRSSILGTNQYPNLQETMLDKLQKKADYPSACLKIYRGAQPFEKLRLASEQHIKNGGKPIRVFLLTIGNLNMRKARASFATGFFGCAGYSIIDNTGFTTAEEGAKAAMNAKADIVVICSSDEEYATFGIEVTRMLKSETQPPKVIIAGNPLEIMENLKEAGVDDFIHVRTNVVEFLQKYHKISGIN